MNKRLREWLETWAPCCGAPRSVFEGQFKALLRAILREAEEIGWPAVKAKLEEL